MAYRRHHHFHLISSSSSSLWLSGLAVDGYGSNVRRPSPEPHVPAARRSVRAADPVDLWTALPLASALSTVSLLLGCGGDLGARVSRRPGGAWLWLAGRPHHHR